jgi:copper(I)-binding protein
MGSGFAVIPRRATAALAACCALAATLMLSGCATTSSHPIVTNSAYIPQPTTQSSSTVAYLDIRNNAKTTDRLLSASTSVGGQVSLLAPDGMRNGTMLMRTVQDIAIPSGSELRMNPNSFRLRITGAGRLEGGKDVFITLRFAHAGKVSVVALVTNPASGGGSYFLN